MQRVQRFVGDQRFDLPHYESLIGYLSEEFHAYNKQMFSPLNRIVKNWKIENNGGLEIRINNTADSFLFNTEGSLTESLNYRAALKDLLTLNLVDNATNYVEVQLVKETCASDTVAAWDSTANGAQGEEFTQVTDTAVEISPYIVSNIIAFSGDTDKLPLAIVTTSGGVITNIIDSRKMLFELELDWNFGSTRTDRTISSLKDAYDALATSNKEIKGTSNWFDKPYTTVKLLKEYQNLFFTGGGIVSWEGANGPDKIRWTQSIEIFLASRPHTYTINSITSLTILDGQCVYVDIPEGAPSSALTPVVADIGSVPLSPLASGHTNRLQVIFFRRGSKIYGMMDIPELDSGESATIGEDLPKDLRARLGLLTETTYEDYTSTNFFFSADSYPTALSKLDQAMAAFASDEAKEQVFTVTDPSQTIFTLTSFTINPLNTKVDVQVTVNGVKVHQAQDGTSATGLWKKNSDTEIEFFIPIPQNAVVVVRDERSGASAGGSGSGVDLNNITTPPKPNTNGAYALGSDIKAWSSLYLKDQNSSQIYKLEVVDGVFQISAV